MVVTGAGRKLLIDDISDGGHWCWQKTTG